MYKTERVVSNIVCRYKPLAKMYAMVLGRAGRLRGRRGLRRRAGNSGLLGAGERADDDDIS